MRKGRKMLYSLIRFLRDSGPGAFDRKMSSLLNYLEQDIEGVKRLADIGKGHIQVAIIFHNGNTMLGGPTLEKNAIHRISALGLSIDFDLYAAGNFYK